MTCSSSPPWAGAAQSTGHLHSWRLSEHSSKGGLQLDNAQLGGGNRASHTVMQPQPGGDRGTRCCWCYISETSNEKLLLLGVKCMCWDWHQIVLTALSC